MMFKVVKQLNPIKAMKTFTKPSCNLYMEEQVTVLKKISDKCVMFMNNNLEIKGPSGKKRLPVDFASALMIPFNG